MTDLSGEVIALMGSAAGVLGAAALGQLLRRKTGPASPLFAPPFDSAPKAEPPPGPAHGPALAPLIGLPVQSYDELVKSTRVGPLIERTAAASELNPASWQEHVLPVLRNTLELVQLLPASESHHHAGPGGLIIHLCETAEAATRLRRGTILPPNRASDDVSQLKHRWTVGLIIAALLHDIGKPVSDVRVRLHGPKLDGMLWNAMAGSMHDAGATSYLVHFPGPEERDYGAHQKLGSMLMQRIVPSRTLAWLSSDPALTTELFNYLADETGTGPLATLVKKAEQQSVARDLREGLRTRFSSARVVPLIERLMAALRRMLAEGGHLPLNRPGAAGYVFEGEIWFAAARLANEVRAYLYANESSSGVPGPDKNDRFFDTWQDYGACITNPDTGRALWSAAIEFDEKVGNPGYVLDALIKFPLELLFRPENVPGQMPGKVLPFGSSRKTAAAAGGKSQNSPASVLSAPGDPEPVSSQPSGPCDPSEPPEAAEPARDTPRASTGIINTAGQAADSIERSEPTEPVSPPVDACADQLTEDTENGAEDAPEDEIIATPGDRDADPVATAPGSAPEDTGPVLSAEQARWLAETGGALRQETAPVEATSDAAAKTVASEPGQQMPPAVPATSGGELHSSTDQPAGDEPDAHPGQHYLDAEDSAASVSLTARKPRSRAQTSPALSPVTPAIHLPTGKPAHEAKELPSLAIDFMAWVQGGIADGSLKYNCSDAMVHFVKFGEDTAVLLVSPSIFRAYAQASEEPKDKPDDGPGRSTQRAVTRAGWHLKADSGKNIWAYQVIRKGRLGGNMLNGFLLPKPERFFDPVPPPNPQLVLWNSPIPAGSNKEN